MKLLIVIVILLGVAAIAQAVRVHELAKKLSGKKEEDIIVSDNNLNANLWLASLAALLISFFYLIFRYKDAMLPEAASEHGVEIDTLMDFNMWLVCIIFVIMNILLMVFAWKYRYQLGKKAYYYPHNDKLEMIWTVIPALTMAVIIIYGLMVWNDITSKELAPDSITIELYGKQFDWTVRYAGEDRVLGPSSFNFISGTNPLGIITPAVYDATLLAIDEEMATLNKSLKEDILSASAQEKTEARVKRLQRQKVRVLSFDKKNEEYAFAKDDIVMDKGVFYIPVNREVNFKINSRDVIHSAFMPHFRMQMNAVPGMTTFFKMVPTITTAEMKVKTGNEDFEYLLLCNKICGAAHYNMKMTVKVVEQAEYDTWLSAQAKFDQPAPEPAVTEGAEVVTQNQ
jgi:cytochrome c oxidase subunit 2